MLKISLTTSGLLDKSTLEAWTRQKQAAIHKAVAIASRRPPEWVTNLALDDAVRLAEAVFEVNADFFIQRVLPSLTEAATRVSQTLGVQIPGAMPSSA